MSNRPFNAPAEEHQRQVRKAAASLAAEFACTLGPETVERCEEIPKPSTDEVGTVSP